MGLLKELASFPLKDNPFFAKVITLGGNFNSEAIIDSSLDSTGYDCQMLGDLKCEEDFPKCSGSYYHYHYERTCRLGLITLCRPGVH